MSKEKDWNAILQKKIDSYDPEIGGFISGKIKRLIKKGADPNYIIDDDGTTLLMDNINNYRIAVALLKYGADVHLCDKDGNNALLYGTKSNLAIESVKLLVEYGIDVNVKNKKGITALMYQSQYEKHPETIKFLIESGADVNAQSNNGNNALMFAVQNNATMFDIPNDNNDLILETIKVLAEAGANINQTNQSGNAALHFAVAAGFYKSVKFLLENGADINLTSIPLLQLMREKNKSLVKLLKSYGVKDGPFSVQYKTKIKCRECGTFIPLNGPANELQCHECFTKNELREDVWESLFSESKYNDSLTEVTMTDEQITVLGIELKRMIPTCSNNKCKAELIIDQSVLERETNIKCPKCKKEHLSFPVPEFFKKHTVSNFKPAQIIGGEKYGDQSENKDLKSVAVKCLTCGASMKISRETPRMCTCEHCSTQQYLSDAIWMKLHPVQRRKAWYIYFSDNP